MDITVYLPDEIGRWAKDNDINLSGVLRAELTAERERSEARAALLQGAEEWRLAVEGDNGHYTARLHGTALIEEQKDGVQVFLGEDDNIYVYDGGREHLHGVDVGELRDWITDDGAYVEAMRALGEDAVIDVGQA